MYSKPNGTTRSRCERRRLGSRGYRLEHGRLDRRRRVQRQGKGASTHALTAALRTSSERRLGLRPSFLTISIESCSAFGANTMRRLAGEGDFASLVGRNRTPMLSEFMAESFSRRNAA